MVAGCMKDNAKMALIPAGSFEMGDSKDEPESWMEWMEWSRLVLTVELDAFYVDFRKFVRETGYEYDRWDEVAVFLPTGRSMIFVSWHDALA